MNMLDRLIAGVAPRRALDRARARSALNVLARFEAAELGKRTNVWRASASDADSAAARRGRLAAIARDLIRNNAWATRGQMVIANNVVGDGIIPKVRGGSDQQRARLMRTIEAHFDTTAIDADGRNNLYGLQRLAMQTIVDAGEVLIRRRRRRLGDGLPLPFQIEVLEPDFLDTGKDGVLANGNAVREGIEYDAIGRRVNYWLFDEHPGGPWRRGVSYRSRPVAASEIIHCYRQDRPGQMRGVSWFAPVALALQDLHDHQDAQLMRQKIAACFAAFRTTPDGEPSTEPDPAGLSKIVPGRIQNLPPGEEIRFAEPPGVEGYDEFTRSVLAAIAAGLGVTYEALTGDLRRVNFTSGRMGRMEMDRNVSSWQWLMLIPQMMQPLGAWFLEAWGVQTGRRLSSEVTLEWVPPRRALVDPTREVPALRDEVRAGFKSRTEVIRELGHDPERVTEEIAEDAETVDALGLVFDSDARKVSTSGVAQSGTPDPGAVDTRSDDEETGDE